MDDYFRYDAVRRRHRVGPLSDYLDAFARLLAALGYATDTGKRQLRIISRLSLWMGRRGLRANDLDEHVLELFLQDRRRRGRVGHTDPNALGLFLEHLRQTDVVERQPPDFATDVLGLIERDFEHYLLRERGLAVATIANYLRVPRAFLTAHVGKNAIDLDRLQPRDVIRFVRQTAHQQPARSAKIAITGLRAFLRFLFVKGRTEIDLVGAVPTIPDWKAATLPESLKVQEVESLLRSCDRATGVGKRDYAVLCLLARLGLRAGEVVALTLDDIDWNAGELTVRGKGQTRERLPLLAEVGRALVTYLREARPTCPTRHLFVRVRAPYHGFARSATVCRIVDQAVKRAGLKPQHRGAHLLRHSLATTLLQRGASLQEIGDVLRHRHPATTQIYAKVDLAALRPLAQPWPEEAS